MNAMWKLMEILDVSESKFWMCQKVKCSLTLTVLVTTIDELGHFETG